MKKKIARKKPSTALARRTPADIAAPDTSPLGIMQRMARDPKLTVDKLERLIQLNERLMDRTAASEFNAAYDAMVLEIPTISKRGIIKNKAGDVQSRYAKYEDIQRVIKPILKRFGFTLSYRTEWPEKLVCEVVGVLTHSGGHSRESRFRSPADDSGGKNAIQGLGSANAYGRRYSTIDLLNIVCEGVDDDGQSVGQPMRPRPAAVRAPVVVQAPVRRTAGQPITEKQRARLWTIIRNSGRGDAEIKAWLLSRYGWESSKDITQHEYDAVVAAIESPATLPER